MSASDHLSQQQFASTHDLVWKYNKTDVEQTPMEGILDNAHTRGRDFNDMVERRLDYSPTHLANIAGDVSRRGVQKPIGVDYSTTPPTVSDGHTRLIAAYHTGQRRVPVRPLPIGQAEDKHVKRDDEGTPDWDAIHFPRQTRL